MSTINTDALDEAYEHFIEQAIATGCVWALQNDDGWALSESAFNDDVDVMPLWSEPEEAKRQCEGDWSHYEVVAIALEELLEEWLPGMHTDVLLVGINWDENLEGDEVEPLDLLEDFDEAVSSR